MSDAHSDEWGGIDSPSEGASDGHTLPETMLYVDHQFLH